MVNQGKSSIHLWKGHVNKSYVKLPDGGKKYRYLDAYIILMEF